MSFAFPEIDPNTSGAVNTASVPLSRYLDTMYEFGQHDNILGSLNRISEMSVADDDIESTLLDPKTANEKWGVGNLKFDEPVRESVARIMNQRKRDEMDRQFFMSHGSSTGRFVPGMAAALLGAVSNPLDIGIMLVPFVGQEAAAAKATTLTGKLLARRLITRETLQQIVPQAPKLTEAVINGVVGQTLFEIPNLVASHQDMADYGPMQAGFNVLAGGAFAAGMHGAFATLSKLSRGTREEMARVALNQMMRDENIQVHKFVAVDEAAIWEKIRFNEDVARTEAYKNLDMDAVARAVREKYGETVVSPAVKMPDGRILTGESHEAILIPEWKKWDGKGKSPMVDDEGFITDKGRFVSREEAGKLVGLPDRGYNHLMFENDKLLSEQISTANPEQLGAAEFDRYNQLIEENPHLSKVDALKQIRDERQVRRERYLMERPEIQELIERERQAEIQRFMANERAKFEAEKQGRFDQLKQQEIERQIADGRILSTEEIQKSTPAKEHDGTQDAQLDDDIAGLEQDLKLEEMGVNPDNVGMRPGVDLLPPNEKAIQAAVDCILKQII